MKLSWRSSIAIAVAAMFFLSIALPTNLFARGGSRSSFSSSRSFNSSRSFSSSRPSSSKTSFGSGKSGSSFSSKTSSPTKTSFKSPQTVKKLFSGSSPGTKEAKLSKSSSARAAITTPASVWGGKSPPSTFSGKKSFRGTSVYSRNTALQIKQQQSTLSKQALIADTNKFKMKSSTPSYTAKTLPPTISNSRIYSSVRIPSTATYNTIRTHKTNYYTSSHWSPPTYVYMGSPSYGMYDSLFFWSMLDLHNSSMERAAYNHSNDAAYAKWHADAEKLAKDNKELADKLSALDKKLATMQGPKDPDYLPPGMDAEVALSPEVLEAKPTEKVPFRIATGKESSNHEKFGALMKRDAKEFDINVLYTQGPVDTVQKYLSGQCDGFVSQSDVIDSFSLAYPEKVAAMKKKELVLYEEPIEMLTSSKNSIKSIKDFDDDTVIYVSEKGSGVESTWNRFRMIDPRYKNVKVRYMNYNDANAVITTIVNDKHAVVMLVSGMNSDLLKAANTRASKDNLRLVNIDDEAITKALGVDGSPLYTKVEIPSGKFANLQKRLWIFHRAIPTVAVNAVFIISPEWIKKNGDDSFAIFTADALSAQSYVSLAANK